MFNIFKLIIFALTIVQSITAPMYIKAFKPGFSNKTLVIKIICSSVFTLTGIVAALDIGGFSTFYSKCIVAGLFCSLFGDLMLHRAETTPRIVGGGLGFVGAHVLYITAFIKTAGGAVFKLTDLIVVFGFLIFAAAVYFICKLKAGKLLAPIAIYAVILSFMLAKALNLGLTYIIALPNDIPSDFLGGIVLCVGATLFVISDLMLGIGFLGENTFKKRAINMGTYYPAQMLIAVSICLIK